MINEQHAEDVKGSSKRRVHTGTMELGSQAAQPVLEVRTDRQTDGAAALGAGGAWEQTGLGQGRLILAQKSSQWVSQTRELNPRGRVRKGWGAGKGACPTPPKPFRLLSSGALHSSLSTEGPSCQPGQLYSAPQPGFLTLLLPLGILVSHPHCLWTHSLDLLTWYFLRENSLSLWIFYIPFNPQLSKNYILCERISTPHTLHPFQLPPK